jgi:exodeoxyribonuclease V alpha subunit
VSRANKNEPTHIIEGVIETVSCHNPEDGFFVAKVRPSGSERTIPVVGNLRQVQIGCHIRAHGTWNMNPNFGRQFRATFIELDLPRNKDAVIKYLGSGILPGVGKVLATRIVDSTWPETFEVLDRYPGRIERITGVGLKRGQRIHARWKEIKEVDHIEDKLRSCGVSQVMAQRIFMRYGTRAMEVVQNNPYSLADDVRGIGFQKADDIATKLFGFEPLSPYRLQSGVQYVLSSMCRQHGHSAVKRELLIKKASSLLSVAASLSETALDACLNSAKLIEDSVAGETSVYVPALHRGEIGIVEELRRLRSAPRFLPTLDVEKALVWVTPRIGRNLSVSQMTAARVALTSKVSVITGGPGTGKTTLVRTIIEILMDKGARVWLCAPTGLAAKRLASSTDLPATTVHRLLQYDPATHGFQHNRTNPLVGDVFVADEWSMGDITLTHAFLRAIPDRAMVILVGDVDQLPSIQPGSVLRDLIRGGIPTGRLTEVFRQASGSGILDAAYAVNNGRMPVVANTTLDDDFVFIPRVGAGIQDCIIQLIVEALPLRFHTDPVRDVQILTPFNRGPLGTDAFNGLLQKVLLGGDATSVTRNDVQYSVGDKIIQTENNYDLNVYNGDRGLIESIDHDDGKVAVLFDDDRRVVYDFDELDNLRLAYGITIHRSQGSEFPFVIMPASMSHSSMLSRALLYTGMTRSKQKLIIVGEERALALGIKNTSGSTDRYGLLWLRLRQHAKH